MQYAPYQFTQLMTSSISISRFSVHSNSIIRFKLTQAQLIRYFDAIMSTDVAAPPTSTKIDLTAMTHLRPAEIKTYHQTTYDRIAPSTTFDGKDKTVLITGGGL